MIEEIKSFIEYCKDVEAMSTTTINAYSRILYALADYLGPDKDVKTIRKHHLQTFIDSLPNHLSAASINNHIYTIRSFFKYLLEFDFTEGDFD